MNDTTGLSEAIGSRIRRVDLPEPDLLTLTLASAAFRGVLLLSTRLDHSGIGLVTERPKAAPIDAHGKRLRNELEGARIESVIATGGSSIALDLRRAEQAIGLIFDLDVAAPNALILDSRGAIVTALHLDRLSARNLQLGAEWSPSDGEPDPESSLTKAHLFEAGEMLLRARTEVVEQQMRVALTRALQREKKRMERRLVAIAGDLHAQSEAPHMRARASALLSNLSRIPARAKEVELDLHDGNGPVRIELDPAKSPVQLANGWFDRARKLESGSSISEARHRATAQRIATVSAMLDELLLADGSSMPALAERAHELGIQLERAPSQSRAKRDASAAAMPYRQFEGTSGRTILVGRNAVSNDELTFRVARPSDLWLHVRGVPGSHVVIPLAKREVCPPELLLDGAALAAHFSDARTETVVDVLHVPRRNVRKPRGGKAGAVVVIHERVLVYRSEPKRLDRLLGRDPSR